jgi:hypothetical protein
MPLTKSEARKIALTVPGTSEKPYFNKPSIFVGDDFLMRVHDKEDAIALRVGSMEMRDVMLEAEPRLFYITDHYKPWPMLLARLKVLDKTTLKELVAARMGEIDAKAKKKKRVPPAKKPVAKKKMAKKKAR